jgi:sugar phosphate isomerase/epimerase
MNRRTFITTLPALAAARSLLAAAGAKKARIGLCTFSCHQHWNAVRSKHEGVKFNDALSFYRYARELGAEGAQTPLRSSDAAVARRMRALVEETGGYYEAELRLPKTDADLAAFETEVRLAREAGATVARAVFMNERRYEVFKTMDDFRAFEAQAVKTLALLEPIAHRHRLKVAIENHKDHTADELAAHLRRLGSEWVGELVDTGNNIALCEEPHAAVETLAPFAMSVHLKDMAVQPGDDGFLLSEVPLGTGLLDLPRLIATLAKANPALVINLEMATRDPLRIPCRTDGYWATFPERKAMRLDATLAFVKANPPKGPVPAVSGKPVAQVLAEEETNNRASLGWMQTSLRA